MYFSGRKGGVGFVNRIYFAKQFAAHAAFLEISAGWFVGIIALMVLVVWLLIRELGKESGKRPAEPVRQEVLTPVVMANDREPEETVPGETMQMLAERFCAYAGRSGIEVKPKDAGKIFAEYAATGSVRLYPAAGTDPGTVQTVCELLAFFFGEKSEPGGEPSKLFTVADETFHSFARVEIEAVKEEDAEIKVYYGISENTFRSILRETEEEYFLPEEVWKKVDVFFERGEKQWLPGEKNWAVRRMERTASILLATGSTEDEALDRALHAGLLPQITIGNSAWRNTARHLFEDKFADRKLPQSKIFLKTAQFTTPASSENDPAAGTAGDAAESKPAEGSETANDSGQTVTAGKTGPESGPKDESVPATESVDEDAWV